MLRLAAPGACTGGSRSISERVELSGRLTGGGERAPPSGGGGEGGGERGKEGREKEGGGGGEEREEEEGKTGNGPTPMPPKLASGADFYLMRDTRDEGSLSNAISSIHTLSAPPKRSALKPGRKLLTGSSANGVRITRPSLVVSTSASGGVRLGASASAALLPTKSAAPKPNARLQSSASVGEGLVRTLRRTTSGTALPTGGAVGRPAGHVGAALPDGTRKPAFLTPEGAFARRMRPTSANTPNNFSPYSQQAAQKSASHFAYLGSMPVTGVGPDAVSSSKMGSILASKPSIVTADPSTSTRAPELARDAASKGNLIANHGVALDAKLAKALVSLGGHNEVAASQRRMQRVGTVFERAIDLDAPFAPVLRRIKGEYEDALKAAWSANAEALLDMSHYGSGTVAAGKAEVRCAELEADVTSLRENNSAYADGMRQLEAENEELRHELVLAINHARHSEARLRALESALHDRTLAVNGSQVAPSSRSTDAQSSKEEEEIDEEAELARELPPSARPGAAAPDLGSGRLGRVPRHTAVPALVPALDMEALARTLAEDEAAGQMEAKDGHACDSAEVDAELPPSARGAGMGAGIDDEEMEAIGLPSSGGVGGLVAKPPMRPLLVPALEIASICQESDDEDDALSSAASTKETSNVAATPPRPEGVPALSLVALGNAPSYQEEFVAHEQRANGKVAATAAASGAMHSHAAEAIQQLLDDAVHG